MDEVMAFIAGALTKLSDGRTEELKVAFSTLAGLIHAYLMMRPDLYPLIVGTVLGNVIAGKIDTLQHRISASIVLFFSPFANHTYAPFILPVTIVAFLDEKIPLRPLLPALIVSLVPILGVHQLVVFLMWEIGYRIVSVLKRKSYILYSE